MKTTILSEYGFHEALLGMGPQPREDLQGIILPVGHTATMPASKDAP